MKFRHFFTTALILLLATGAAQATQYKIDGAHSSVSFTIRHIVSRVPGHFNDFKGMIVYDEANPGSASVQATIQTGSIDTGNERRDTHLRSDDFFDAERYPEITFVSSSVAKKDANMLQVTGDLTLHGVTRKVSFPVEVIGIGEHPRSKAPVAGFEGKLVIKRSDFGVNNWADPTGILGDEVNITLNIEAVGVKMDNPCNPCATNPCNPCGK